MTKDNKPRHSPFRTTNHKTAASLNKKRKYTCSHWSKIYQSQYLKKGKSEKVPHETCCNKLHLIQFIFYSFFPNLFMVSLFLPILIGKKSAR